MRRLDLFPRPLPCAAGFLGVVLLAAGCDSAPGEPERAAAAISAAQVRRHVLELSGDAMGGRGGGYAGERRAAEYIAARFAEAGLEPAGDGVEGGRSFLQEFEFLPSMPQGPHEIYRSQNVVGLLRVPGARKYVVVGAHYDGQGQAGEADPGRESDSRAPGDDEIWNSANDNASGVAAVIEIAAMLAASAEVERRSILFVAFGAEEHALAGSAHYVANPPVPLDEHVAMLNIEQFGRNAGASPFAAATASGDRFETLMSVANERTGLTTTTIIPGVIPDTDTYPFLVMGIPAMTCGFGDDEQTHTQLDEAHDLSYDDLAARAGYVATLATLIANDEREMLYTADCARCLGVGLIRTAAGAAVANVQPGSWGERAGLRPGDVIVEIDGQPAPPGVDMSLHDAIAERQDAPMTLLLARGDERVSVSLAPPG